MKKIIGILLIVVIVIGGYAAYNIFGPAVSAPPSKYFYIKTGATYNEVIADLKEMQIVKGGFFFDKIVAQANYKNNIKPGRYQIKNNSSIYALIKMLKAGKQTPVKLIINKLRLKEELAAKIGNNFECDSLEVINFLNNKDTLANYLLDSNTVMSAIIPNTYELNWNSSPKKIFSRLKTEQEKFWNNTRTQKAAAKNLTPLQIYTLASIVQEETNKPEDMGKVASVYLNRLKMGMKLGADPTVIFALKDFSIRRVLTVHTQYPSAYNTYLHQGLPPGPICTPSINAIDATLNSPATDYIYFVAQPNLTGYSNFATNYTQHMVYAKVYQQWLSEYLKNKAKQNK